MTRPPRAHLRRAGVLALTLGLVTSTWSSGSGLAGSAAAAPGDTTTLQVLSSFDDFANGSLRDQGPWSVNTPGSTDGALASDDVPGWLSGKALWNRLAGADSGARYRGNAYATLGDLAVPDGTTGTLFFELATTRLSDTRLHLGLSTDPSPGLGMDTTGDSYDLDDFGPQVTLESRGLVARDGDVERVLSGVDWQDDGGYRVWLVVDNDADEYSVHAAPREAGSPVQLRSGGRGTFAFRTAGTGDLSTFLHLNDADAIPSADTYLDHLALAPAGIDLTDPTPRFAGSWDFEADRTGDLGTQDGWIASRGTRVITDPTDAGNQVVRLPSGNAGMRRAVPSVADGATGTTFLRLRRTEGVDLSAGLTDVDEAAAFADYRSQLNSQGSEALSVRNGSTFSDVGTWKAGAWQCFWLVSDNRDDQVSVYTRGGRYRTTTRLSSSGSAAFDFRSPTTEALDRLLLLTGRGSGPVLVDDVAVDPSQVNLRIPSGRSSDCEFAGGRQATPVADPAPTRSQPARLTLSLTTVAQLPPAAPGSTLRRINAVVAIPGSDRLAIPSLEGPLFTVGSSGTGRRTYLDLAEEFPDFVDAPGLGSGFGYVAYAPDFATSGRFYTVHTEAGAALDEPTTLDSPDDARIHGVVTEWTADDPGAATFAGTRRQVLRLGFSRQTHGLQQISFNPSARPGSPDHGLLYLGVGDGDEAPVFSSRPGRLDAPQGKVLRIDPRATPGGAPYSVPAGNPYVGVPNALGEIYASGLRNPHRFSWDPVTGRLFLGNIGEKKVDSIYDVRPGDDFGWNSREGRFRFEPSDPLNVYPLPRGDRGFTYPALQIGRGDGTSLVGGYPYEGRLKALRGHYLFGDIVSGRLQETSTGLLNSGLPEPGFHGVDLVVDGRRQSLAALTGGGRVDLRMGQDARGELYVLSKQLGRVWKITGAVENARGDASCRPRGVVVRPSATPRDWKTLHRGRWTFRNGVVRQVRPGPRPRGIVRPWEYATIRRGPNLASFDLRAEVRLDRPTRVIARDVVLLFQYTGPRSFSYVHLSSDPASYAHNGIFVVDDGDRRRIDDQFDGRRTPRPAIRDRAWHDVRIRHCAGTGETAVYVDGAKRPVLTSGDTVLGKGRIGFGSFDDMGRIRDVRIRGTRR